MPHDSRKIIKNRSLSARRAWIEIIKFVNLRVVDGVALRKESVDRNRRSILMILERPTVALRKESVDRNREQFKYVVQCRKSLSARRAWIEIHIFRLPRSATVKSLSARRAWIEIYQAAYYFTSCPVALRKESVDRNKNVWRRLASVIWSLSARRAWIEITHIYFGGAQKMVALRKESVDRNVLHLSNQIEADRRSPQGERG